MSFQLLVRRIHLYVAMFLMPWFLVYGLSSVPFSHSDWFRESPQWTVRFDRPYDLPVADGANLREVGARILRDMDLKGGFGASRPRAREISVYRFDFWSATRITYFLDQKRLVAEDRGFRWASFLTGMHARGGFEQHSFLDDAWAVTVDVVCVGFLVWIASGLYMWWQLRQTRSWGFLALGGGIASFVVFLFRL